MRSRKKSYTEDILLNSPYIIKEPQKLTIKKPVHLEIGTGKGSFLVGMSEKYPDINFVGMEKEPSIVAMAAKLFSEKELKNTILIHGSANNLTNYFEPKSIHRIYLNFSDPWPKSRTAKRRLTYGYFLDIYKELLVDDGQLHFKTDNTNLFDFSLLEFKSMGWKTLYNTRDLHNEDFHLSGENVMTEYEKKFSDMGQVIYRGVFAK